MNHFNISLCLFLIAAVISSVNALAFKDRVKCAFSYCKSVQRDCYQTSGCLTRIQTYERCQINRSYLEDCKPYDSYVAQKYAECLSDFCGYSSLTSVKTVENNYLSCLNNSTCASRYDFFQNRTTQLNTCYNNTVSGCNTNTTQNTLPYHNCVLSGYFKCEDTVTPYNDLPDGNPLKSYQLYSYATVLYDLTNGIMLKISLLLIGSSILFVL